jgi:hypothetical protein
LVSFAERLSFINGAFLEGISISLISLLPHYRRYEQNTAGWLTAFPQYRKILPSNIGWLDTL